jgi:hypothetical protein
MSLKDDPTVERIREARHRISEEQEHDPQRVVNYYVELQKQYERRLLERTNEQHDEPVEA